MSRYIYKVRMAAPKKIHGRPYYQFTGESASGITPIGYCGERFCTHETEILAADCYRMYLLDKKLVARKFATQHQCQAEGCGNLTTIGYALGDSFKTFHLCQRHQNRETVEKLFPGGQLFEIVK